MKKPSEPSHMQLRILYVVNLLAIGGAEMFLLRKIQQLRLRGHYAALAYCEKQGSGIDMYLDEYLQGKDIFPITYDAESIKPLINKLGVNIIHTVQGHPKYLKSAREVDHKIKCFSTLTGNVWEADKKFNHRQYTDMIVTMTENFRHRIKESLNQPPAVIAVVGNGVDLNQYQPIRVSNEEKLKMEQRLQIPFGKSVILHIARINPVKNIEDSLRIARKVFDARNDCIFLCIGSHQGAYYENYFNELLRLKESLNLNGQYLFIGEQSTMSEFLNIASCVICTTKRPTEGTPNALLEALAVGKPIVALNSAGIPDVVINGKTGFIVDNSNISEAAERISSLLDNALLRRQMGMEARKLATQKYDLDKAVMKYEKLYVKSLRQRRKTWLYIYFICLNRLKDYLQQIIRRLIEREI